MHPFYTIGPVAASYNRPRLVAQWAEHVTSQCQEIS